MMKHNQESALPLALKSDTWYQQLLRECAEAESHYLRICSALPEEDQALLEQYISLCEELEYRRAHLESQL